MATHLNGYIKGLNYFDHLELFYIADEFQYSFKYIKLLNVLDKSHIPVYDSSNQFSLDLCLYKASFILPWESECHALFSHHNAHIFFFICNFVKTFLEIYWQYAFIRTKSYKLLNKKKVILPKMSGIWLKLNLSLV